MSQENSENTLIRRYAEDPELLSFAHALREDSKNTAVKGLVGSMDSCAAVALASVFSDMRHVFVLHDREEAAYFHSDLRGLGLKDTLFFPSSAKRPYRPEETENANVLQRAEVLNELNQRLDRGWLLVTYPEALSEKVINKRSLKTNTYTVKEGDEIDVEFLCEMLVDYGFERSDFVYEAGQFAVRGGIIDIYSYSADFPFRIELFGDEVESVRSFDPETQLSVESVGRFDLIPDVQTKLTEERRESFLDFIPESSVLWFKDYQLTLDVLEKSFEKAGEKFEEITAKHEAQVVLSPEDLYETADAFAKKSLDFRRVEFGNRFYLDHSKVFERQAEAQPSFNKNFELLAENLDENSAKGLDTFLVSDSEKQLERLRKIFEEISPNTKFEIGRNDLRAGFVDKTQGVACYTDHQIFERFHRFKTKEKHTRSRAMTLKELRSLKTGDFVTHVDHGIGRFAGLELVDVNGRKQESIRLIYKGDDLLYVSLHALHKVSKYSGKEGVPPAMSKLGSQEWNNKKKRAKSKVMDIADDLIKLYARRKNAPGFAFPTDDFMQAELESSFLYEDTPDQAKATKEVKADMELAHPMDRLVCGDVGFGKTEIAIRAAFKSVASGKQVAVLVPTTILAMQHHRTFSERLSNFPVRVEYINRFKSAKQVREILTDSAEGKVDILIGTHRLANKDVKFKDLGLMVIDEEQKFGVKVKEKLKEMRVDVDALTLTATPIPRTLHFSLMGARDLSVISTPPPNRQPVTTEIHTFGEAVVRDAVSYELRRGGQVFFVHNRVEDIESIGALIKRLVPDARIAVAHGQMEGAKLERVMVDFIDGAYDVLVSTNIIESGLDIPNANTIVINQAHMFGLSDLHQMRGRVGRSNRKAFCYLLSPPVSVMTGEARKRLSTLEEFSDLGDGFKVAMRDLDIRGAGNLLGAEQSGFITDLGFEMYHKILDEAVKELKETKFKELFANEVKKEEKPKPFVEDCNVETDWELLVPEDYVSNTAERLGLYTRLDKIKEKDKLDEFVKELKDRFGKLPRPVEDLVKTIRVRWQAQSMGFERLTMKGGVMRGYFVSEKHDTYFQSPVFGKILSFVQKNPKKSKLKELKGRPMLVVQEVTDVDEALGLFENIQAD
ncbi:transcription-repair-coupling factor [Fulvitalea axinellae]|uniref:Transcription-repair-coupling factor n=1 Tax=Fulvitalea axinellae TaxID=1182444 RepID=A0AAU9CPW1_9BACT|nr:transcription-repair-coupling factor [Fulvitalea axinellae]